MVHDGYQDVLVCLRTPVLKLPRCRHFGREEVREWMRVYVCKEGSNIRMDVENIWICRRNKAGREEVKWKHQV